MCDYDYDHRTDEQIRRDQEEEREKARKSQMLLTAGYVNAGVKKKYGYDSPKLMHHESCGEAVFSPEVHDPLCRANGKGRKEPLLEELKAKR